ncbi:MAG: AI-2E family transporter [Ignavibacteria bacterium]|nr:AI-2E family transporter [Ignavibacteria bacterium]
MNEVKSDKFKNFVFGLILLVLLYVILKELQSVLIPFFVAIIIAFIFEPFYSWMLKKKVPAVFAIIIVLIIILIIANISSVVIFTSISSFQAQAPTYQNKFLMLYGEIGKLIQSNKTIFEFLQNNINLDQFIKNINIGSILESILTSLTGLFINFILILIYVVFIITEIRDFKKRLKQAYTLKKATAISNAIDDVFDDIKSYLLNKSLINFVHAVIAYIVMVIFNVDFAIVWAFLIFLAAYIPNIGATISTIIPFLSALLQYGSLGIPLIVLLLLSAIGFVMGNIVEPKVFGNKLNLSPILILFALIFWGYLWGIVGMFLAVPIMSMIKIILSKFEGTKPISLIMSNEIRLTYASSKKTQQMDLSFKNENQEIKKEKDDKK